MSPRSRLGALLVGFSLVATQSTFAERTTQAELERMQSVGAEFMEEMGSPAIFKQGSFKPHTGDSKADNVLNEFHEMWVAVDANDFAEVKVHQKKAQVLFARWHEEQKSKLDALRKNH